MSHDVERLVVTTCCRRIRREDVPSEGTGLEMYQELGPHEVVEVHAEAIPDRRFRRGNGLHERALLMHDSEGG